MKSKDLNEDVEDVLVDDDLESAEDEDAKQYPWSLFLQFITFCAEF